MQVVDQKRPDTKRAPAISLPKGGGAIRGIGEKLAQNPVNGTASLSVPIATSPGRADFSPQLALSYDSGAGNGPFGFGWSLSLPSISRKTAKGLPRYEDATESDVFLLSGAEDLVPVAKEKDGEWTQPVHTGLRDGVEYVVKRYRPRVEGLFARIERWTDPASGDTHWRSISKDNVTTLYGLTSESRIADPSDPRRIFSWLICESHDDKGNVIRYDYVAEDSTGIDPSQAHEANRTDASRSGNRYLKRVFYGNTISRLGQGDLANMTWLFEVVFDYDEDHLVDPDPDGSSFFVATRDKGHDWGTREDPFSSYHPGFELRTYRLCRRVLTFHHFPDELGTQDCLVRATELSYEESPIASFIIGITQSGFVRKPTDELANRYLRRSWPGLELEYTKAEIDQTVHEVDRESLENLPQGLDGASYRWLDLDGEGLSGILTEQATAWFYKRNLSPIAAAARFAPLELLATRPSIAAAGGRSHQFMDLAGDGQLDVAQLGRPIAGYYERTPTSRWQRFVPFESCPNLEWDDPNVKLVDLTGDGHADVMVTEEEVVTWYPSLAERGFGPARQVRSGVEHEQSPRQVFADGTESIHLADMSGDGLTDLVRIRNNEVCYWPNLGYGRFGAKVTMADAPHFDLPDLFNQERIRLSDIDGSGTTDIIYLGHDKVDLYRNQAGNGWSPPQALTTFPDVDSLSSVVAVDLLGNGTGCLVWSSPKAGDAHQAMRFVDLMGGQKPHLLKSLRNNLGAETRVHYAPSTRFYLADKLAGKPWITKLPFPVHVVERVETYDHISRNRFVARYAYHHGYFDGRERELRGFGLVEQWDTEEYGGPDGSEFAEPSNLDEASRVPPVLTRTWFHTGAYLEGDRISRQLEGEYYRESDLSEGVSGLTDEQLGAMLLDDTVLPAELPPEETHEACRALKGSILRQEVYGLDGTEAEDRPYSVSERNYTVERLQGRGRNRHAVFFIHPRETVDFHYERQLYDVAGQRLADPRVSHAVTLEVDDYGNVLRSVAIAYGRRHEASDPLLTEADRAQQSRTHVTYTENRYTKPIAGAADAYRAPLPAETRTYELLNVSPAAGAPAAPGVSPVTVLFRFAELAQKVDAAADGAHDVPYHDVGTPPGEHPARRLIEHVRTFYRKDNLNGPLPLYDLEPMALAYEDYKLASTPLLIAQNYDGRVDDPLLAGAGGYVHSEGDSEGDADWWIPSGRTFYSPNRQHTAVEELAFAEEHFFLPHRLEDPYGNRNTMTYDGHHLLLRETKDELDNVVRADLDYRVLQPKMVTGPNGNREQVAFDALQMVAGTAVMGKPGANQGDSLEGFEADPTQTQINGFLAEPKGPIAAELLGTATTRIVYDVHRYSSEPDQAKPAVAATLARETHANPAPPNGSKIQVNLSYSDGFGREIQKKVQAEPGPVEEDGPEVDPRWVGSGWTIYNNKGKPVRQYEPFFTDMPQFELAVKKGVSPILFYDPLERVVATLHPNHTYEKIVFDPWQQTTWDVNDTVLMADPGDDPDVGDFFSRLPAAEYLPTWHASRSAEAHGSTEQTAAARAAAHADTPTVAHLDSLARTFLTVADNGLASDGTPRRYATRVELDIEGNQRSVSDALARKVMTYDYDMLGNRIHERSMDGGDRWMLANVAGNPIRSWDAREHAFETVYDALHRPTEIHLRTGNGPRRLVERLVYGEDADPARNLRTRLYQHYDQAGVATNQRHDFKGNLSESSRRLARTYDDAIDWTPLAGETDLATIANLAEPALEPSEYTSLTRFDALNRPVQSVTPHAGEVLPNVLQPSYNEANLLDGVDLWLRRAQPPDELLKPATADEHVVENLDYDAKGQRTAIEYGNGARTDYEYDPETFQLTRLVTTRPNTFAPDQRTAQKLSYTYDPAGNITTIHDSAQEKIFFNNQVVGAHGEYQYDAIYRLIGAQGREHIGQVAAPQPTHHDLPRMNQPHPNDGGAIRRYVEQFEYDEAGNIQSMVHSLGTLTNPGQVIWKRRYAYQAESLTEPGVIGKISNRLTSTSLPGDGPQAPYSAVYPHDEHGNITAMTHLPFMAWDHKDQLRATSKQVVKPGGGTPEITYYVYDASGERVRKVTDNQADPDQEPKRKSERLYLGGFEIYHEYKEDGTTAKLERETLHVMDGEHRVALIETKTRANGAPIAEPKALMRYQLGNHLGSVCLELDETAKVISYEEYHPYGTTAYHAVAADVKVSAKRYRYTGKERDRETGFAYHGARYYAPWLGRWISTDPAGFVDGPNLYLYALASPPSNIDATGRQSESQSFRRPDVPELDEDMWLDEDAVLRNRPNARPEPQCAAAPSCYRFSPLAGRRVSRGYKKIAKKDSEDCMTALYSAIASLYGKETKKQLFRKVLGTYYKVAIAHLRRKKPELKDTPFRSMKRKVDSLWKKRKEGGSVPELRDVNHAETLLKTAFELGLSASAITIEMKRKSDVKKVLGAVEPFLSEPGFYFFGLSLGGAYHTAALGIEIPNAGKRKVFIFDQFGGRDVTEPAKFTEEIWQPGKGSGYKVAPFFARPNRQ